MILYVESISDNPVGSTQAPPPIRYGIGELTANTDLNRVCVS